MDIIQSPTDNLYIFLTLAGITFLVFSISFFYKRIEKLNQDTREVSKEIEKLTTEVNISEINFDQLKGKIKIKMQYLETRYGVKFLDANDIKQDFDQKTNISEILKSIDKNENESFMKDYTELIDLLYDDRVEKELTMGKVKITKLDSRELTNRSKQSKLFLSILIFSIISSLIAIAWGFYMWYFKHQIFQDELLQHQLLEMK